MFQSNGRICRSNGLLLAAYFIPAWFYAGMAIIDGPLQGMYEMANLAPALFVTEYWPMSMLATLRFAWLLACVKLLVVGFFALASLLSLRTILTGKGDGEEALGLALLFGAIVSVASMGMAAHLGQPVLVNHHATESLLLLGGLIILGVDSRNYGVRAKPEPHSEAKSEVELKAAA